MMRVVRISVINSRVVECLFWEREPLYRLFLAKLCDVWLGLVLPRQPASPQQRKGER